MKPELKQLIGFAAAAAVCLGARALTASPAGPSTNPSTEPAVAEPIDGDAIASIDEDLRYFPTSRPSVPPAQHPPLATPENVDTNKPVHQWQRLTDDWFGVRPKLDDRGISFDASITTDWTKVVSGGVSTNGSSFLNLFNANLTLDTKRLMHVDGGTFYIDFQNQSGQSPAPDAGDLQGISNIDADGRTQISELWYEQVLLDQKLRVKVGKVDANSEFAHAGNSDEFVNGSFGVVPTMLAMPTYPDPAMSLNVFVNPTPHLYGGFGIYDGSTQLGRTTGDFGPVGFFKGGSHLYFIGEAGLKWTTGGGLDGRIGAGAWHHNGPFERFDGKTDSSATGEYVIFDQALWRENPSNADDSQGIGCFAQYGHADGEISAIEHAIEAGLTWTGAIPTRDDDVLGIAVSFAWLSSDANLRHDDEAVYEAFYRLRLTPWFSIKPDLQYIHNASADDGAARDTLAATLRAVVDF